MPKFITWYFLLYLIFFSMDCFSQELEVEKEVDTKYREDQFYVGATYNLISSVPSGVQIRGLSGGFQFGFLRDMPVNQDRNIAIAIGLGFSFDEYGQTLFIGEELDNKTIFTVLNNADVEYTRNRFSTSTVEIPLEFRWRSSTASSYRFWRVYGGLRAGYTYWYKSTFKQDGNTVVQTNIPEFDKFRLGATISFGYNTFNLYAYYSINPFFKDAAVTTDGQNVEFRTIKVGLMFYLL